MLIAEYTLRRVNLPAKRAHWIGIAFFLYPYKGYRNSKEIVALYRCEIVARLFRGRTIWGEWNELWSDKCRRWARN